MSIQQLTKLYNVYYNNVITNGKDIGAMNKKDIVASVIEVIIFIAIIVAVLAVVYTAMTPNIKVTSWEEYKVGAGDTLWTIVPTTNKYDIRDVIDLVKNHNNIGDTLNIGQVIELPVLG